MTSIARGFFTMAVVYGLLGMLLGLHMAVSKNHGQMPTHAHIMVIGWVSFAIFGLFYHLFAERVVRLLAVAHFWIAQLSVAGIVVGLWLTYGGQEQYEPIAAISSIAYAASFLIFAIVALPAIRKSS